MNLICAYIYYKACLNLDMYNLKMLIKPIERPKCTEGFDARLCDNKKVFYTESWPETAAMHKHDVPFWYLENKLFLITINFTHKTSHSFPQKSGTLQ